MCMMDGGVEQSSLGLAARRSKDIQQVGGCGVCQLMALSDPPDRIAQTQEGTRWRGLRVGRATLLHVQQRGQAQRCD